MTASDRQKHIEWLRHEDITNFLESDLVASPWFSAYRRLEGTAQRITWFSALVPLGLIEALIKNSSNWDVRVGDGGPTVWSTFVDGKERQGYSPYGNESGIEPLVVHRSFHGIRPSFPELAQEFRLYHNLYPEPSKKRLLWLDDDGNESEAGRFAEDFLEIRADLLMAFCAIKQMALAVYVDSWRDSKTALQELGLEEVHETRQGPHHIYSMVVAPKDLMFQAEFQTTSSLWGKKYILPGPRNTAKPKQNYQEFVIGSAPSGAVVRHTCNPERLRGVSAGMPSYFTPVFFRREVLSKYYADPEKYIVADGYLRCGVLWDLRMDNDHTDYVVVYLGDLGKYLSEAERIYWLSFNIPPDGRTVSDTNFQRSFMAEFASPKNPDLVFKHEYNHFNRTFQEARGWNFFLPLHEHDAHFLTGLRLLSKDSQAEFDSQLLALTKILVDSLNEKEIAKGLATLVENDKGIAKLQKFFTERAAIGYEPHIKFLRVLQDLRSKSAAHRKGNSYDELIGDLQIADEGQQKVFAVLLVAATEFIRFLKTLLIAKS